MGHFGRVSLGKQIKGLLADKAFHGRLTRARAFLDCDDGEASMVGREIRDRRRRRAPRLANFGDLHMPRNLKTVQWAILRKLAR
jgi:hypothetical protein